MQELEGRRIHGHAEMAREGGNFSEALRLIDEAFVVYSSENNDLGKADVMGSEFLTLRHLYEQTGDIAFMIRAKHAAMCAVELAEHGNDKTALAVPYQRLGQAFATLEQWDKAVENISKAVEHMQANPPAPHARPAVLADMHAQLAHAEYMAGDTSAKERLDAAIAELLGADELPYNKDVWLSGAYMRGAEMLHIDDPEASKVYLAKAKEVIDANAELKLRKQQWEKLSEKLGA